MTITRGGTPQSSDPLGNHWTFTGRFLDEESGLLYYRARYYDPATGRFLQRDPLGYSQGPGLFTYVASNLPNRRDPSGLGHDPDDPHFAGDSAAPKESEGEKREREYREKEAEEGEEDGDDGDDDDDGPAMAGSGGGQKPSGDDPDYRIPWDDLINKLREAEKEKGPEWLRLKRIKKHRQRQGGRYGPGGGGGVAGGGGGGQRNWWAIAGLTLIAIGASLDPVPGDEVPAWIAVAAVL